MADRAFDPQQPEFRLDTAARGKSAGTTVRGSVLLDGCVVEAGAQVEDSILAPGVTVAAGGVLTGEVVGQDQTVPAPEVTR